MRRFVRDSLSRYVVLWLFRLGFFNFIAINIFVVLIMHAQSSMFDIACECFRICFWDVAQIRNGFSNVQINGATLDISWKGIENMEGAIFMVFCVFELFDVLRAFQIVLECCLSFECNSQFVSAVLFVSCFYTQMRVWFQ